MPEFFLELFSEEIPARMQLYAADKLASAFWWIIYALDPGAQPTQNDNHKLFCGPRRIALSATVGPEKPGKMVEERGPRDTAPEMALSGFLKKHKANRDELITDKGYFVLRRETPPEPAFSYIRDALPKLLADKIEWPKSMRWGQSGDFSWIRPLRRVVCLLDGEVIPIVFGPIVAGNVTEGHRTMSPLPFAVTSVKQWQAGLRDNYVVADFDDRAKYIELSLQEQALKYNMNVVEDKYLLAEVPGLVDWPVVLIGKIDSSFMVLPPEVRELSMKVNQRYFALRDADGQPAPYFAFVANQEAPDGGAAIIAGNERVLRARLTDARHFWEIDLAFPLNVLLPKLEAITFHASIGTQRVRADRIAALARNIANRLGANDQTAKQAEWAGLLCKTDLVTGMVGEFPELQGIMGGYYAERFSCGWDGSVVGPAIKTHYQPKGPTDEVPSGIVSVSVALADKIDTLREFFRIGEGPTGSGDPYALRRAALGVIRIILENDLRLPLKPLLDESPKLFDFIIERLRVKLRGDGRRFDVLDAVLGAGTDDDLARIVQRVDAITNFAQTSDGVDLLVAYRRAANILRIEDGKDGPHRPQLIQETVLLPEEVRLQAANNNVNVLARAECAAGNYEQAMSTVSTLRVQLDDFFKNITVNAPEPELRLNRLRLLAQTRDTMNQIADFSKIEV